jgi:hypothetical protein
MREVTNVDSLTDVTYLNATVSDPKGESSLS